MLIIDKVAVPLMFKTKPIKIAYITSIKLFYKTFLPVFIGCRIKLYLPFFSLFARHKVSYAKYWVGWGRKKSGKQALQQALQHKTSFMLLEDGFIYSMGDLQPGISIICDNCGIYYDAYERSQLETFITIPLDQRQKERALHLIYLWRKHRISKYNAHKDYEETLPDRYVLVIDQVPGDLSIQYGHAEAISFDHMLKVAMVENPNSQIVVKLHPYILVKRDHSHFDIDRLKAMEKVKVIEGSYHPVRLIEKAQSVYTVSSQIGFEALIWGKAVHNFGMPFYGGWGLSHDRVPVPYRRKKVPVSLEQLIYASLVRYSRYVDPFKGNICQVEQAIEYIARQREKYFEFPQNITAIGFSFWKRGFISLFLQGSKLRFIKSYSDKMEDTNMIALWGCQFQGERKGCKNVLRIEDGFLRSLGLGAHFTKPISLVFDPIGMYYDATRASYLEHILKTQKLDISDVKRAKALRRSIVDNKLTKYNVGTDCWVRAHDMKKVILVVGQVESDASIELGSPEVKSNKDLLQIVRKDNPKAYIIYKPHPDIAAGLRDRDKKDDNMGDFYDEMVLNVSSHVLLNHIDELHTMTSLMGFEALIRGVEVVCYGMPFYAGWGLTKDKLACQRRTRKVSIDELVFGALITYPRYVSYKHNIFIEVEQAIDQLSQPLKPNIGRQGFQFLIRLWCYFTQKS